MYPRPGSSERSPRRWVSQPGRSRAWRHLNRGDPSTWGIASYIPEFVEGLVCELRVDGVRRSSVVVSYSPGRRPMGFPGLGGAPWAVLSGLPLRPCSLPYSTNLPVRFLSTDAPVLLSMVIVPTEVGPGSITWLHGGRLLSICHSLLVSSRVRPENRFNSRSIRSW